MNATTGFDRQRRDRFRPCPERRKRKNNSTIFVMKHLGILALLSAALFATAPASAQSSGGLLMDRDIVTPGPDLFELSDDLRLEGLYGRRAIAGAFTSLGSGSP